MSELMDILTLKTTVHIFTGNEASKKAADWKRSFERGTLPKMILVSEPRKNVAVIFEIEHRDAHTIGILADGGEARDRKEGS